MLAEIRKYTAHLTKSLEPHVYVVSYPKSGRTWLRLLIGKTLCEKYGISEDRMIRMRYMTTAAGLHRTQFIHDGSATDDNNSYKELSPDKSRYKNNRIILLSRDIKDILVSSYFQATKREETFNGSISDFVRSEYWGAMKILTFYKQWHEQRHVPADFLFVRYEDLHEKPEVVLQNVFSFLGAPDMEDRFIQRAIEYCRFENLRRLEKQKRFNSGILSPKDINDPESFKTRKGLVGNYREYLSDADIAYIDKQIDNFGCEFTSLDASPAVTEQPCPDTKTA